MEYKIYNENIEYEKNSKIKNIINFNIIKAKGVNKFYINLKCFKFTPFYIDILEIFIIKNERSLVLIKEYIVGIIEKIK